MQICPLGTHIAGFTTLSHTSIEQKFSIPGLAFICELRLLVGPLMSKFVLGILEQTRILLLRHDSSLRHTNSYQDDCTQDIDP